MQVNLPSLIDIVLTHIQEVSLDILEEIRDSLGNSSISYLLDMFNFICEYSKTQSEQPSLEFLQSHYAGIFNISNEPLTKEVINILLFELKKDSTITKTMMALNNRDIEEAQNILQGSSSKADFTETKAEDICKLYDEMKSVGADSIDMSVPELDRVYKGFSYGTNNFIAAPQKAGKTTAALSIFYDALMRGKKCIYLTLEVRPFDVYANLYTRHASEMGTKLNAQLTKKILLTDDERPILEKVQENFINHVNKVGGAVSVVGNSDFPDGLTFSSLNQLLEMKQEEWGRVDLVVIDHINLTGFMSMKGVKDSKDRINAWIKYTTDLCKSFNNGQGFILITLMQINRQGTALLKKGKQIGFDALADANEAERSCHTCSVMYSDSAMRMANQVKFFVLANRNGAGLDDTDSEDGSITTYMNYGTYTLGHRKYSDKSTISLNNRDLLKNVEENKPKDVSSLFGQMLGV